MGDPSDRRPWTESPDEDAPPESWLSLEDDDLLHRIETLGGEDNEDDRLLEVVASDRHFFIRQEAAKRVRDRDRLFVFEGDRHVGQILVRHLTRREDVTYLQQLSDRSHHVEVRSAAQVQLARLWQRLDAPKPGPAPEAPCPEPAPTASEPAVSDPPQARWAEPRPAEAEFARPAPAATAPAEPDSETVALAAAPKPAAPAASPALHAEPVSSHALAGDGVDGSLLGWAAHFVVEQVWSALGTSRTRDLLLRIRRDQLGRHPTLVLFEVTDQAQVAVNLGAGLRLPGEAVAGVAAWLTALRGAAVEVAPEVGGRSIRDLTALVADALADAGFYDACAELERGWRR